MFPNTLFKIFTIEIDMYSILLTLGVVLCLIFTIWAMRREKYSRSARETIISIAFFAIAAGLLFAVLFQSFYDFLKNPENGFKVTGRMTFIGGLIGGVSFFILFYLLFVKVINPKLKDNNIFKANMNKGIFELLPIAPISITIAHSIGRMGCFCAGCCYGVETDAWYGVQFPGMHHKVIPTQLFEAIFLFVLTAVMLFLYLRFDFKYNFGIYGISYGIWRFIIEFYRGDDRGGKILGLSPSQFWSILLTIGGIVFFFIYRYFLKKKETENNVQEA